MIELPLSGRALVITGTRAAAHTHAYAFTLTLTHTVLAHIDISSSRHLLSIQPNLRPRSHPRAPPGPASSPSSTASTACTRPLLRSVTAADCRQSTHRHTIVPGSQPCAELQNSAEAPKSNQFFHLFCQPKPRGASRPATCNVRDTENCQAAAATRRPLHSKRPSKIPETARSVASSQPAKTRSPGTKDTHGRLPYYPILAAGKSRFLSLRHCGHRHPLQFPSAW